MKISFITERGSLIIFDSEVNHGVTKVRSGERKSIVGWVMEAQDGGNLVC